MPRGWILSEVICSLDRCTLRAWWVESTTIWWIKIFYTYDVEYDVWLYGSVLSACRSSQRYIRYICIHVDAGDVDYSSVCLSALLDCCHCCCYALSAYVSAAHTTRVVCGPVVWCAHGDSSPYMYIYRCCIHVASPMLGWSKLCDLCGPHCCVGARWLWAPQPLHKQHTQWDDGEWVFLVDAGGLLCCLKICMALAGLVYWRLLYACEACEGTKRYINYSNVTRTLEKGESLQLNEHLCFRKI